MQLQDKQEEQLLKEKQMHLQHERFLKELEFKHATSLHPSYVESSAFECFGGESAGGLLCFKY